jgi:hypothetical protein
MSLWACSSQRNPRAARADHLSAGLQPRTHALLPLALFWPLPHAPTLARSIVHQAGPV